MVHQIYILFISVVGRFENHISFDLEYAPIFYIALFKCLNGKPLYMYSAGV